MSYTIIIIIVTALVSFAAFNNQQLYGRLIFYPYGINQNNSEYFRFLTSGFIHADWNHLIFNMITLYFFGQNVEYICAAAGMHDVYIVLYLTAIIVASMPAYAKHRQHSYYYALGASGGVSAILFTTVYFQPWNKIQIIFIPIGIPSIIFAALYLYYSAYMAKKGQDNIGHDAHLYGSIYGFIFAWLIDLKLNHGLSFIQELMHPVFR